MQRTTQRRIKLLDLSVAGSLVKEILVPDVTLSVDKTKLIARLVLRQKGKRRIECQKCKKQYIGETKRTLRERFTEHRQATNNPSHANATAAVPTHFNLPDHSIKDMKLIPLELQPTNNASRRKAREAYFIDEGQTLTPHGINRRNEH